MPDLPSFEENLATALDASFENPRPKTQPVLFVLSMRNWKGYNGLRLRNEGYSAYPAEKQLLLFQGLTVFVLKVQKVSIDNSKAGFEGYTGK